MECFKASPDHVLRSTFKYLSCDNWLIQERSVIATLANSSNNSTRRNLKSNKGGDQYDRPKMARERI
uniref:Uncharacterized protein n=1 Tax=Arundo donax TaxID=35708 RepID=A0A0A9BB79_ARUDO